MRRTHYIKIIKIMTNRFRPSVINIEQIKNQKGNQGQMITVPHSPPSPNMSSAKKRKRLIGGKTNQEIVKESHEQLMEYIDEVDEKVQGIIQTYEAEFLSAYKDHIRRVRDEMDDIKKRSLSSANSQNAYLQKIQILEKQLRIFRQDSMTLFDKLSKKDKQISLLTTRVKQLQTTVKQQQRSIYLMARKNKQNQVIIQQTKDRPILPSQSAREQFRRNSRSQNKQYPSMYSPMSKELMLESQFRPYSTSIKSARGKNKSVRLDGSGKNEIKRDSESLWVRQKIEEKIGTSEMVPIDTVIDILAQRKATGEQTAKQGASTSFRKARSNYMAKMQARRSNNLLFDNTLIQKSKEMSEANELKTVLKNCIEEVRKDIARRGTGPTLNFFKENGPKSYGEFKKVDHMALIQMVVSNEVISRGLYELIFNKSQ